MTDDMAREWNLNTTDALFSLLDYLYLYLYRILNSLFSSARRRVQQCPSQ